MTVDVVTVYTPRKDHPKWMDYGHLLKIQKRTAKYHGHTHIVVTDVDISGYNVLKTPLPDSLMHAIMAGQIAYLKQWNEKQPLLFVDIDCVIARDLRPAFKHRDYDIGLTMRLGDHVSRINNGAMYIMPGSREKALAFFEHAYTLCLDHWGGDQEAISKASDPIPREYGIVQRDDGLRINFLSLESHNIVPEKRAFFHKNHPFVVHFKGESRKAWMESYARLFILNGFSSEYHKHRGK